MLITKSTGEKVEFNRDQYVESLRRAGLNVKEAGDIANQINQDLYPEISSEKIYNRTKQVLKQRNRALAAKYSLKRAIVELGPAGFYFERYMTAVLTAYGYKAIPNQFVYGRCVQHEIDIIAQREGKKYMIECKFHHTPNNKSDLKTALYVYARFLDVKDKHKFDKGVLITNTRFTIEAVKYAKCVGLDVIGWRNPQKTQSLEHLIESKKLYPVTTLVSLNKRLKDQFREADIVLASDLLKFKARDLAKKFKLKENFAQRLIDEAGELV